MKNRWARGTCTAPARGFWQLPPVSLFRIGSDQDVLRSVVHAAQVAGVHGVSTPPFFWRGFQHQNAGPGFTCREGGAKSGVTTAYDEYVVSRSLAHDVLPC